MDVLLFRVGHAMRAGERLLRAWLVHALLMQTLSIVQARRLLWGSWV
jgi:hypothetical protein